MIQGDAVLSRRAGWSPVYRRCLNVGIVLVTALILYIALSGGGEIHAFGLSLKFRNVSNPIVILVVLLFLRFAVHAGFKNFALLLAAMLITALSSELLLRVLNPEIALPTLKGTTEPSPDLGYRLIPRLRVRDLQTNSHGLRDVERPWAKPSGVKRVLGLGDSFAYGYQVKVEECYLKRLEKRLSSKGERWDVINAGVSGYNMWQYLAYLERYGYRYEPDYVVLGIFFDDFKGDPPEKVQGTVDGKKPSSGSVRILNLCKNGMELLSKKLRFLNAAWLRSVEERRTHILGISDGRILTGEADPEVYRKFEVRLQRIKETSARNHSKLIVMFIPDIIQVNHPGLQVVNGLIRQMSSRLGLPFLDLTPIFERQESIGPLYMLPHDAHTSPRGHDLIAGELERLIRGMSTPS